jgi:hemerythrin
MGTARIETTLASHAIGRNISETLRDNGRLGQSIRSTLDYIKRVYLSSDLMRIRYDETYTIGIAEFDGRRQTIAGTYNAFNAELRLLTERNGSMARLNHKAALLVRLIGELFEFEEALMAETDYPEFPTHRAKHIRFLQALHQEFERIQLGNADMYDLSYLIGSWLTQHMKSKDKNFAEFVNQAVRNMQENPD